MSWDGPPGDPGEPGITPEAPTNLRLLKPQAHTPSPTMLSALKELLAEAERGEVIGCVVYADHGAGYSALHLGKADISAVLLAHESWKFSQLMQQLLICPTCGSDDDDTEPGA